MNIRQRNIEVFQDTRLKSISDYLDDTRRSVIGTTVYKDAADFSVGNRSDFDTQQVFFETCGTISQCIASYSENRRVCALNFADALTPGGLVLEGEVTQEEDLCRCSSLYETLAQEKSMEGYYHYNKKSGTGRVYTDALIYSPSVRVLKNDVDYSPLDSGVFVDIITCPSPSCRADESVFLRRITGILKVARFYSADIIILGAWGCGAFGQDAYSMGSYFAKVLSGVKYFKEVHFAIKCVNKGTDTGNFSRFKDGFYSIA